MRLSKSLSFKKKFGLKFFWPEQNFGAKAIFGPKKFFGLGKIKGQIRV